MELRFDWIHEPRPAARWKELFRATWPSYEEWFLLEGEAARPSVEVCREKLREHMPELVPIWERLTDLAGGSERVARMLSLYRPTPFLAGCSQAVSSKGPPLLVRNYDYKPDACEGVFLLSEWSGSRVLAASDCLWGALDGINEHGLAVSLSFGGRRTVGDGFGIPLIVRYVLELCRTTTEAAKVLRRVPCNMAYNVLILDAQGERAVAYLAPGRQADIAAVGVTTNHQRRVEWARYDRFAHSVERKRYLKEKLRAALPPDEFTRLFLAPPLFRSDYDRAFGTLYTAAYSTTERSARFLWTGTSVTQTLDDFTERELLIRFPV